MIENVEPVADAAEPSGIPTGSPDVRSMELATFLRRRRAALSPSDVGLRDTNRRRTPGLRREEVAELANISTTLYTWLEQGRDIAVSKRTIEAVANALQLSAPQRRHFSSLASPQEVELDETVSPALRRLIDSMRTQPVFVLDHAWDIVARNHAARAVFGETKMDESVESGALPNFLEFMFLDPELRAKCVDWENVAANVVAIFRFGFASFTADTRSITVIENLRARSPVFAADWEEHVIRAHPQGFRAFRHSDVGLLKFEPTVYAVVESPGLRMLVYCPVDAQTGARMDRLTPPNVAG